MFTDPPCATGPRQPQQPAPDKATDQHSGNPAAGHTPGPTSTPGPDPNPETLTVHELLRRLGAGELAADTLTPALRQQCVNHLTLEGYSNSSIAHLLGVNERTVTRDRTAFRQQEALAPDRRLGDELLGEYQRITIASIQRLSRMCNDPEAPPYSRLWAEEAISRNYQRFVELARRIRYFEEGAARLAHQRDTDPQEAERHKESLAAGRRRVMAMLDVHAPLPPSRKK